MNTELEICNKCHKYKPCKCGRPTVVTEAVLKNLRTAYLMGSNDREACVFAGISPQTLYNYQSNNPEFVEQKTEWKLNPTITARITLLNSLDTDVKVAFKYLQAKLPEEFGNFCQDCKKKIRSS